MATPVPYLLDTNVVLFATRENSAVSAAIDRQFGLRDSFFRPAISEVTVAELLAFAESWGDKRRNLLKGIIDELLMIPIPQPEIHTQWAKLYSYAKANGLPIQHDHNDIWIASTAKVAGLRLLSTDGKAYLPLRGTDWLEVEVIDAKTGELVP